MSSIVIASEPEAGIARLTVNRPDKLNALTSAVLTELNHRVVELEARAVEQRPRVVIVTGAGDRAFVAGADISEMAGLGVEEAQALSRSGHELGLSLEGASFVSVAAVNGFALGGGCELALCCDLILASDRARFGQPELGLGLIPGFGATFRLPARVGLGWARRLLYTGEVIDAAQAERIGLADRVVSHASLADEALALARSVASRAPQALAVCKRSLRTALAGADAAKREAVAFASLFATQDAREGMTAFLSKRAPKFTGR